jgi:hypothetical protein
MAKCKSFSIPLCKQDYILGTGNTLHNKGNKLGLHKEIENDFHLVIV